MLQLKQVIMSMTTKSCALDSIPTSLLKQVIDAVIPIIHYIVNVNKSLQSGHMPNLLKTAIVSPLLKKKQLDSNELCNYRPISNLSFLSKVIERCVYLQVLDHLTDHNLLSPYQSGYRHYHSCETAITKIYNDLTTSSDSKLHHGLIILLDMTAAFDTQQHNHVLEIINKSYSIDKTVLKWLQLYLTDRNCCVIVN